jgi:hypothetical protein
MVHFVWGGGGGCATNTANIPLNLTEFKIILIIYY